MDLYKELASRISEEPAGSINKDFEIEDFIFSITGWKEEYVSTSTGDHLTPDFSEVDNKYIDIEITATFMLNGNEYTDLEVPEEFLNEIIKYLN